MTLWGFEAIGRRVHLLPSPHHPPGSVLSMVVPVRLHYHWGHHFFSTYVASTSLHLKNRNHVPYNPPNLLEIRIQENWSRNLGRYNLYSVSINKTLKFYRVKESTLLEDFEFSSIEGYWATFLRLVSTWKKVGTIEFKLLLCTCQGSLHLLQCFSLHSNWCTLVHTELPFHSRAPLFGSPS